MQPGHVPGNVAGPTRRILMAERAHKHRAALEARKVMAARGEVPFYNVRAARVADLAMMADAWLQSYRFSPVTGPIPPEVYRIEQRDRVRRLITRSKALCAVDDDNDSRVTGWVVFEPPRSAGKHAVLHYMSVHPALQNLGLGAALMGLVRKVAGGPDDPVFCTHYTFPMKRLMARWNLIYNPYLLEVRPDDYP